MGYNDILTFYLGRIYSNNFRSIVSCYMCKNIFYSKRTCKEIRHMLQIVIVVPVSSIIVSIIVIVFCNVNYDRLMEHTSKLGIIINCILEIIRWTF